MPLANEYSREIAVCGAMFRSAKMREGSVAVSFDPIGAGLMVGRFKGVQAIEPDVDDELNGFELIGPDGSWHPANASIDGEMVIVSSSNVKRPIAVRYACHPQATKDKPWNLYSKDGLPASPFCSDWTRMPYDPMQNPMPKK